MKYILCIFLIACAVRGPNEISRAMERQVNALDRELTDDPRIVAWCADAQSRRHIVEYCRTHDEVTRKRANQAMEDELREAEARVLAEENAKARAAALASAAEDGATVLFDRGVGMTLVDVREGRKLLKDLKKVAIELWGDTGFVAMQVIDQNNVIFRDTSTDAVVWLKNYARVGGDVTWIEGAELTSMEWGYVYIRGTMTYKTLLGSKQAVIVEVAF